MKNSTLKLEDLILVEHFWVILKHDFKIKKFSYLENAAILSAKVS